MYQEVVIKFNMASSLVGTITTNFLYCSICFMSYHDPRALPCQHRFCHDCLVHCLESSADKRTLVCPICLEEVKLSREGVDSLPVHFLISSLQDTIDMETKVGLIQLTFSKSYLDENCLLSK